MNKKIVLKKIEGKIFFIRHIFFFYLSLFYEVDFCLNDYKVSDVLYPFFVYKQNLFSVIATQANGICILSGND